ncbi:hypothetical protein THI4931_04540 [Pandoraea sputorum]|nr:hypothetical protein THI4931_04540 [Pandoraea sputorum]
MFAFAAGLAGYLTARCHAITECASMTAADWIALVVIFAVAVPTALMFWPCHGRTHPETTE